MTHSASSSGDGPPTTTSAEVIARVRQLISGRVAIAVGWTAFAAFISQVIRFAGTLIMTRLLAPEMFGVMAIVLSVYIILTNLMDVGLRAAVIQSKRGDDPEFLNTVWTAQIIRSIVISCALVSIALTLPVAADLGWISADAAWASPLLPLVLAVSCVTTIINGCESTNSITAERNISLKRYTTIKLAAQLFSFFCMVLIGYLTRSIWALVVSGMISSLIVTVLSHFMLPGIRNRLAWSKEARTELARYGSWIMLSSAANVIATQADRLFLGGLIDSATLGLYSIAFNLAVIVEFLAATCIASVFMPALSEAYRHNYDSFRRKYFQLRLPLDAALLITAGGIFATGPLVIEILYDDRYLAAGGMLQALSFILVFARYHLTNAAYMACGKPEVMAVVSIIKCVSLIVLLFSLFEWFGLYGAIYAVSLHSLFSLFYLVYANQKNKLNDFRFEAAILLAWPFGYFLGLVFIEVVGLII